MLDKPAPQSSTRTSGPLSGYRIVEFGTGESASLMELGGFNVGFDAIEKRRMWTEAVEQCADMMVMDPYPGFKGEFFEMPCRNILPKPVQRPHPPL